MNYDEFYASNPAYFGNPFPEVLDYFRQRSERGALLDVGCGQGRNAVPLAEMGYAVTAIDTSGVAVDQLNLMTKRPRLLEVERRDLLEVSDFSPYVHVLLDGFFHFNQSDLPLEQKAIDHLVAGIKSHLRTIIYIHHSSMYCKKMYSCPMYSKELLKGTLIPIILSLLSENGKMYGYEIYTKVKDLSDGKIVLKDGSLYPVLQKMHKEGTLAIEEAFIGKRVRKYYHLTASGEKRKLDYLKELKDFMATINLVVFQSYGPA